MTDAPRMRTEDAIRAQARMMMEGDGPGLHMITVCHPDALSSGPHDPRCETWVVQLFPDRPGTVDIFSNMSAPAPDGGVWKQRVEL